MSRAFPNPAPLVTAQHLHAELDHPDLRLFDCTAILEPKLDNSGQTVVSGRSGYEAEHIPGAAFLDLAADLSDQSSRWRFAVPARSAFEQMAGRLGIGDGVKVVLYDRTYGAWAARVWWMLRGYGFDAVRVLDGGLTTWRHRGLPLETGTVVHPPHAFIARPRPGHFADKAEVMAAIGGSAALVNALLPEQHEGRAGVHYGRPGRIPGSCNIPSRGIVDPVTQAFLPVDELQRRFSEQGLLDGRRVIAYCGGGIAASLTALALTALGAEDVGVYMSSMQEWADDPASPMQTGPAGSSA